MHVHLFLPSSFRPSHNKIRLQDELGDRSDFMTLLADWNFVRVRT